MSEITFDPSELVIAIEDIEDLPEALARHAKLKLSRGAQEAAREMKREAPKAFSTLTNSIKVDRRGPLHWRIGPNVKYGEFQERGTRAGGRMRPIQPLIAWVKRKGITNPERSTRDIAWAIAHKLRAEGMAGKAYAFKAAQTITPRINTLADEAVRDAAREFGS